MVMYMSYFNNKMLELIPGIFVIPGNTNIGVITDKKDSITEVYIVDSGNTEVDGEYILETLDEYFKFSNIEYKVKAIINTHAHADHCGGNAIIQKNTQCEVWASHFEKGSLENPNYHTSILWGAIAPKEIDTIYYRPEPCTFTKSFCENDEFLLSNGTKISYVHLPGHSFESYGILCTSTDGKNTLFAGDAIFPRTEIGKFNLPFTLDYSKFLASLDKIGQIENLEWCIPGHGDFVSKNIHETIEINKISIYEIEICIMRLFKLNNKMSTDLVVKEVADAFDLKMNVRQYSLIHFTIKCFLTTLRNNGSLKMEISDNILYWKTK